MNTVAQKEGVHQEGKELQKVEDPLAGIEPEKFWEELANAIRGSIRITLEKAISYEFSSFVGALE
ncbi:MAG: hypothetical protein ACE5K3_08555 [bacterium]